MKVDIISDCPENGEFLFCWLLSHSAPHTRMHAILGKYPNFTIIAPEPYDRRNTKSDTQEYIGSAVLIEGPTHFQISIHLALVCPTIDGGRLIIYSTWQ